MLKRSEVIGIRETCQRNLRLILACILRVLEGTSFRKSLVHSERNDRCLAGKILKIAELVSNAFLNVGPLLIYPTETDFDHSSIANHPLLPAIALFVEFKPRGSGCCLR